MLKSLCLPFFPQSHWSLEIHQSRPDIACRFCRVHKPLIVNDHGKLRQILVHKTRASL